MLGESCLLGPFLLGPFLLGPFLLGPFLLDPCLLDPCLLGPCLLGPCLLGLFPRMFCGQRLTLQRFTFLVQLGLGFLLQLLQLRELFGLLGIFRFELGSLGIQARLVLRLESFHPRLIFLALRFGLGFRRAACLLQLDPLALRLLQGRVRLRGPFL